MMKRNEIKRTLREVEKLLPLLSQLAIGPSKIAGPDNTTSLIAVENLRRAIPCIRKSWGV